MSRPASILSAILAFHAEIDEFLPQRGRLSALGGRRLNR
jgi:hypothetical protein